MHLILLAAGLACAATVKQAPLPSLPSPLTPAAAQAGARLPAWAPSNLPQAAIPGRKASLPVLPAAGAPVLTAAAPAAAAPAPAKTVAAGDQARALVSDEGPALRAGAFDGTKAGLRVLWWNLEAGQTNAGLPGSPLDRNLRALAVSETKPHVLALGEYRLGATLQPRTLEAFEQDYEQAFLPYNSENPDIGILVLALRGLGLEVQRGPELDWSPPDSDAGAAARYRRWWLNREPELSLFSRAVSVIRVAHEGMDYRIVPVHLLQPWSPMNRFAGKVWGTLWTLYQLLAGRRNPLLHQAVRLKEWLGTLGETPYLLLGDMNAPPRSRIYRLLARGLTRVFPKAARTFPSFSSQPRGKYPALQIDHAFASGLEVVDGSVPPLKGSDHYPLAVTVGPPGPGL